MKTLIELFFAFFRIGLFTIGGGYAMLPIMQKELVKVKKWVHDEEILDYYTIGQSTPGIIAVNTATFVGYKLKKKTGAIAATAGIVTPSLIIITIIAAFFARFQEYDVIKYAFKGISAAVIALLFNTIFKMGKRTMKDLNGKVVAAIAFILVAFFNISPIYVVIGATIFGISFYLKGVKAK